MKLSVILTSFRLVVKKLYCILWATGNSSVKYSPVLSYAQDGNYLFMDE
jgi:hypothetical protein